MSPNEFQLRDALRAGEGDSPDPDAVIRRGLTIRRARRKRLYAAGGGVAAVALLGLGTTAIVALGRDGGGSSASKAGAAYSTLDRAQGARSAAGAAASASASSVAGSTPAAAAPSRANGAMPPAVALQNCPAVADRFMLPGGGGSGQFGSGGALFAAPVAQMRVCAYPVGSAAAPRTIVLSGAESATLAASLNAATDRRTGQQACPPNVDYLGGTVELLAVDARGKALAPVVITLGCLTSEATNGTAVRYVRNLPDRVTVLVVPSSTKSLADTTPGKVPVSPVR